MKKGIKFTAIDSKRLTALLMSGIILTTAVGCKSNNVDKEPVDNDVQIEDVVDNPVQDVEQDVEQDAEQDAENLKANDEKMISYFSEKLNNANAIGAGTQEAYNELCNEFDFLFDGIEINGLTIYDLSNNGKMEVIGIIREIYNVLGTSFDDGFMVNFGQEYLPIAEELHEIYGEDAQNEDLKEEYFENGLYSQYYKAYKDLLLNKKTK